MIIRNIFDEINRNLSKNGRKMNTADIEMNVPSHLEGDVFAIIRKYEQKWTAMLGEINNSEMRTKVISDERPFKYRP